MWRFKSFYCSMKLTNLKKASDYDVEKWLEKELDLTPYQKDKMKRDELDLAWHKSDQKE